MNLVDLLSLDTLGVTGTESEQKKRRGLAAKNPAPSVTLPETKTKCP